MLGAILLSDYNEIVHTFGNAKFRRAMAKKTSRHDSFTSSFARSRSSAVENLSNNNSNDTTFSETVETKLSLSDTASTSGISSSSADSLHLLPVNGDDDEMDSCFESNTNADSNRIDHGSSYSPMRKTKCFGRRSLEQRKSPKTEIDRNALLEKVLPLTILHRTKKEMSKRLNRSDELDTIQCERLKFRIMDHLSSYLLVFISSENQAEMIIDAFSCMVIRALNFHYGLYIQLIQTGLSGPLQKFSRVERRMEKLMQHFEKNPQCDDVCNINLTYGNASEIQSLIPSFKGITLKIAKSLDRKVRCIFLNSGQVIASMCSDEESPCLLDAFSVDDLMSLIQFSLLPSDAEIAEDSSTSASRSTLHFDNKNRVFAGQSKVKRFLKCQAEQAWLYSNILRRRQFVNVHVFSLTGEIEIICLSNADCTKPIMQLSDVLLQLDAEISPLFRNGFLSVSCRKELSSSEAVEIDRKQISYADQVLSVESALQKITNQLSDFDGKISQTNDPTDPICGAANGQYVYLVNVERTQKLIKSLWSRMCHELLKFYYQEITKDATSPLSATDRGASRRGSNTSSFDYYCQIPASMLTRISRFGSSSLSLFSNGSSIQSGSIGGNAAAQSTIHSKCSVETGFKSGETPNSQTASGSRSKSFRKTLLNRCESMKAQGAKFSSRYSTASSSLSYNSRHHPVVAPAHLDAMLGQLSRVLRGVLNEIVDHSMEIAKNQQLQALHTAIRRAIDQRTMALMQSLINGVVEQWQAGSPLRPRRLGLDMLAYRLERSDVPFNYLVAEKHHNTTLSKLDKNMSDGDFLIARTNKGEVIIQVSMIVQKISNTKRLFGLVGSGGTTTNQLSNTQQLAVYCSAVFPEFMNVALAVRQTYLLIGLLNQEMNVMLQNLY